MKNLILISIIFLTMALQGQVGINTTQPNAKLDIVAFDPAYPLGTDGILIPRVNRLPSDVEEEQDAMLLYLAEDDGSYSPGFYYYHYAEDTWLPLGKGAKRIDDLLDAKSVGAITSHRTSIYFGEEAGTNDDNDDTENMGIGYGALHYNTTGNSNIAIGHNTLYSNTTGYNNIAQGSYALHHNTTGYNNIAQGRYALHYNTTGYDNIALGRYALNRNTTGSFNIAQGQSALENNITGSFNVAEGAFALWQTNSGSFNNAIGFQSLFGNYANNNNALGYQALYNNSDGHNNCSIGSQAMYYNGLGNYNNAIGSQALYNNRLGSFNNSIGFQSLYDNYNGENNNALGYQALYNNRDGHHNCAIGSQAMYYNNSSYYNNAIGSQALYNNVNGSNNNAFGYRALYSNSNGYDTCAMGTYALYNNDNGYYNIAIGSESLFNNISGHSNIAIGYNAGYNEMGSNLLYIENSDSSTPLIGGDFSADRLGVNRTISGLTNTFEVGGTASKSTAGAWLANSDKRLKKAIKPIAGYKALELLSQLKGISYFWNDNKTGQDRPKSIQYGFTAQNIKDVFPEKVTTDALGYLQTAYGDYDAFFVEAIKELKMQLDERQKEIDILKQKTEQLKVELEAYKNLEARLITLEQKISN